MLKKNKKKSKIEFDYKKQFIKLNCFFEYQKMITEVIKKIDNDKRNKKLIIDFDKINKNRFINGMSLELGLNIINNNIEVKKYTNIQKYEIAKGEKRKIHDTRLGTDAFCVSENIKYFIDVKSCLLRVDDKEYRISFFGNETSVEKEYIKYNKYKNIKYRILLLGEVNKKDLNNSFFISYGFVHPFILLKMLQKGKRTKNNKETSYINMGITSKNPYEAYEKFKKYIK